MRLCWILCPVREGEERGLNCMCVKARREGLNCMWFPGKISFLPPWWAPCDHVHLEAIYSSTQHEMELYIGFASSSSGSWSQNINGIIQRYIPFFLLLAQGSIAEISTLHIVLFMLTMHIYKLTCNMLVAFLRLMGGVSLCFFILLPSSSLSSVTRFLTKTYS